jgi:hypothetical protein
MNSGLGRKAIGEKGVELGDGRDLVDIVRLTDLFD